MILKKVTPSLAVNDIKAAITFYCEVLGFDLHLVVPNKEAIEWAMLKCGEVEIMFHSNKTEESISITPRAQLTFHCEGEGVWALYESIKNKVQIVRHIHPTFYGTNEFSIKDCNGITIVFVEKIKKKEDED
jgi:uncharacterized glyoxalase superfamily protein PhnB